METFPGLAQMTRFQDSIDAGREILRAGKERVAFEHKSLYITTVEKYTAGLEWVKSL